MIFLDFSHVDESTIIRVNRRFLPPLLKRLNLIITNPESMVTQPEIVVIGAGAAGIAAATKLIGEGFENLKVLEAENRIGGRIYSTDLDGIRVDLGAQWCHGEKGNIVHEKVKDLELLDQPASADYVSYNFYTSDNSNLNEDLLDKLIALCWESSEQVEADSEHNGAFKEYFIKWFTQNSKDLLSKESDFREVSKMVLDFYHKLLLCYEAADTWEEFAANKAFVKCEGVWLLHWRDKGFGTIIDVMMKELSQSKQELLRDNILLNKIVNRITWANNEKVKIDCSDGTSFTADHVIITVSVGVLKDFVNNDIFTPKLPVDKAEQIEAIPLGTTNKILLKFDTKWWPDTIKDFSFLWRECDRKALLKEFPYGPMKDGRSWLEDVFGFYTIDNHPDILLGWVVGPMAKEIELISDQIALQGCMFLLRKFVGKKFKIPQPKCILRSKWGTNPHFRGSYSYTGMEMIRKNIKNEDLAVPLCDDRQQPVLLFAGEATHARYMSTVHGAIESGYREADRLIKLHGKNGCLDEIK